MNQYILKGKKQEGNVLGANEVVHSVGSSLSETHNVTEDTRPENHLLQHYPTGIECKPHV